METTREAILRNITVDPTDGCWLWTLAIDKHGYGQANVWRGGRRTTARAHRLAYAAFVGPIPEGHGVLHRCDTPACVNPSHLFTGTQADNMGDCARKGRWTPRRNGRAILTEDQVRTIRAEWDGFEGQMYGWTMSTARRYGVSWQAIYAVIRRDTWAHVL